MTDLALREFHLDRRSYPASLSELVPDYLPSPPLDPFSGQSLHYRQQNETYVLYSIGPNQANDGGQAVTWPDLIGGQGDLLLDSPDSLAAQRKAKPGPSPTDGR